MCGVIGVSGITDAARVAYLGLYALQHRGQESAGIVAVDAGGTARIHRAMGLVSDAFSDATIRDLPGDIAVGHTRYSTAGSTVLANAQPYLVNYHAGPLSVAHNGNLTNADEVRDALVREGALFASTSDTEVLVHLIARSAAPTVEGQIRDALERVEGAYSLVIGVGRTLYAAVDSRGFRPLLIGRVGGGVVVASETCALDLVGATTVRELLPGEFVRIDDGEVVDLPPLARGACHAASSNWSISPGPTPRSSANPSIASAANSAANWRAFTRRRAPTWSSRCRTVPTSWRWATAKCPASSWSTA